MTQSIRVYAQAAGARVGHLRLRRGNREVDLIIERRDGRIIAIEVKLSGSVDDHDVRHLRWLQSSLGEDVLDSVRSPCLLRDAEKLLQLAVLVHLGCDVAAADELAVDEELRRRRPV